MPVTGPTPTFASKAQRCALGLSVALAISTLPQVALAVDEGDAGAKAEQNVVRAAFGVCKFMPNVSADIPRGLSAVHYSLVPADMASDIGRFNNSSEPELHVDVDDFVARTLQKPVHGHVDRQYRYHPNAGYVGDDKVTFLVRGHDAEGTVVEFTLVYSIKVTKETRAEYLKGERAIREKYCPILFWFTTPP